MAAYMNSLDKLAAYDFERIAPGHGEVMEHGKQVLKMLRAHRMAREDKVLRCLGGEGGIGAAGAPTIDSLTPAVYDDVAVERHPWAKLTLEAHLIKLLREGRVTEHNGVWRVRRG
jgi:glyoxylase-like metal-dependent hydrolase (beta-lactamase superfamily II)